SEEIRFRNKSALTLDGGAGNDQITMTLPTNLDNILASVALTGNVGNDTITINSTPATVPTTANGNDGDDALNLRGNSGSVALNGGLGNDAIVISSDAPTGLGNL